jgi:hypothetical protein
LKYLPEEAEYRKATRNRHSNGIRIKHFLIATALIAFFTMGAGESIAAHGNGFRVHCMALSGSPNHSFKPEGRTRKG